MLGTNICTMDVIFKLNLIRPGVRGVVIKSQFSSLRASPATKPRGEAWWGYSLGQKKQPSAGGGRLSDRVANGSSFFIAKA